MHSMMADSVPSIATTPPVAPQPEPGLTQGTTTHLPLELVTQTLNSFLDLCSSPLERHSESQSFLRVFCSALACSTRWRDVSS